MSKSIIGFICGSLRQASINKQLINALMQKINTDVADVTHIDLNDYELPMFHGDLDTAEAVLKLKSAVCACDGIIMVSPEYNGSLPPVLKNAIDWLSVTGKDAFEGPVYGLASCTPGPMSGIMLMRQMQFILTRLGADVIPVQVGVGNAASAFDAKGELSDPRASQLADKMIAQMLRQISFHKNG